MTDAKQQPKALQLAECLDDGHCSLRNALHPAATELRRLSQVETEYRERILRLEAALARANSQAAAELRRLIAAAPDLLAACWNVVLAADDTERVIAVEQARAAIAKATK